MQEVVQIVTAFFGLIGTCFTAYLAYLMFKLKEGQRDAAVEVRKVRVRAARVEKKADAAAVEVREVKTTLATATVATAEKLNEMAAVGQKTHDLCNSAMRAQKQLLATTARSLAGRDPTPENLAAADLAERELRQQDAKQAAADNPLGGGRP